MSEVNHLVIVICTYNRSTSLIQTLHSIYNCNYRSTETVDILVIANNCSDNTIQRLTEFRNAHPRENLRLSWIEEPRAGKSYALNTAIANTSHDVLCFIDDDQTVEADFIGSLLDGIATYPENDIYCGRIWPAWDGSEPDWVHTQGQFAVPIRPFPEFNPGKESYVISPHERYPSGGNIVVRRRVFDSVGVFSVALGPTGHNLAGGEDHNFLRRATEKGFSIRYLPAVSQLHAIDSERTSTIYTLKKSYSRSRASFLIHHSERGPRLYMFRKVLSHFFSTVMTFSSQKRFFYLVRLAASFGELAESIKSLRTSRLHTDRLKTRSSILAVFSISCIAIASFAIERIPWTAVTAILSVAIVGTSILLVKSLTNFSQTGPRIRDEIRKHYRRYTLFAVIRLLMWAFGIMCFTGSVGVLFYFMLVTVTPTGWSEGYATLAAALGIAGALGFQLLRNLRYNPGLLVASMHYRISRFYRIWHWATPNRLKQLTWFIAGTTGLLLGATTVELFSQDRIGDLIALLSVSVAFISLITWAAWNPEPRTTRQKIAPSNNSVPNILMIGSDTLRSDRLGAMNYNRTLTPNIDKIAAEGALFSNCYVPCARTAPSLISLLTGTWPHKHGIRDNFVSDTQKSLEVEAIPSILKNAGYYTAAISDWCGADLGKFNFGFDHADVPVDQWNLKYLIRQGPKDLRLFVSLFTHNRLGRLFLPEVYYLGGVPLTSPLGTRARHLLSALSESSQPFLLNLFFSTTHPPFASEWPWYTKFADPDYQGESKFAMARLTEPFDIIRRQGAPKEEFDLEQIIDLYDGCVAAFDDQVGKILNHLEACGIAENTIVVVYSDHGMEFFEHNTWGQGNSAVGEASPKIPLVIRGPSIVSQGNVTNVVRSIDLAPTLLELANVRQNTSTDGVSLAPFLLGMAPCPDLHAFNETGIWITDIPGLPDNHLRYPNLLELLEVPNISTGTLAIKPQYEKIILAAKDRMIRRGRWKLVYQPLDSGHLLHLFDLETDPTCKNDVSTLHKDILAELWRELQAFMLNEKTAATFDNMTL